MARSEGFSLVEVLIGLAITTMIGVSITSVLMAMSANRYRDMQQTDYFESLRLAGHQFVEDGRIAYSADTDALGTELIFNLDSAGNRQIRYIFAWCDGTPDPTNLHRWDVSGGSCTSDAIVAYDLVPVDPYNLDPENQTHFGNDPALRTAEAYLRKPGLKGQSMGHGIKVSVLFR